MGKRARTDAAKEEKANTILDKAAELFLEKDYELIRMADLAKELGISNGILYFYFKTKETLFLCLLWREYEKRLDYLAKKTCLEQIHCFEDIKRLFLEELEYLVDNNPLYIRLESMRGAILERNTDQEVLLRMKTRLFERMEAWTNQLSQSEILTSQQLVDIFFLEAAIITGCKLGTDNPDSVRQILDQLGVAGTQRNFKQDVLNGVRCYLDGYGQQFSPQREAPLDC